ncbi:ARM repeat like protein [Babesia gibsoni]|uniref:ARM repeat like protein n=1 Tax=Babesia gibsoni TaxID=33632 RepID=A0AAD8PDI8_BABGI|nr:ARM repeat like protein [Babesia gibsoni]
MADGSFTATLVTLCRQALSGDRATIVGAEERLKALLQPSSADIQLKIASLFRILLLPTKLTQQPAAIIDDDLKVLSPEVQQWAAICLKNYVRTHFDTSETHGGVSDQLRRIVRCMLIVVALNSECMGVEKGVLRQLEETLHMLADGDFPHYMEFFILFMNYCHLSDVAPEAVAVAFANRVQKAAASRAPENMGITGAVENSESLARSLDEAKSTVHLQYCDSLMRLVTIYAPLRQALLTYGGIIDMGDVGTIGRAYGEFLNNLLRGIESMCEALQTVTLNDLELGKFLQAAAVLFPKEVLTTHMVNLANGSCDIRQEKGDPLIYFDDRKLYKDPAVWQGLGAPLPEAGGHGKSVKLVLRPDMFVTETSVDMLYFKRKVQALRLFKTLMNKYKSSIYGDSTLTELKIILVLSENMMLYVFKSCFAKLREYVPMLSQPAPPPSVARMVLDLLEAVTQITKVLTYIHSVDLPETCEDNVHVYLGGLMELFRFSNPIVKQLDQADVVMKLKVSICKLMRYYAERYQEVFHPFVFTFIEDVVNVCRSLSQEEEDDKLVSAILDFFTASASTHWGPYGNRASPFTNADFLADMMQAIILPNIGFRECDLYLIDDSPVEFVQRELDTGSGHSRRFSAINFLKKLVGTYGEMVQQIINQFAQNVANANDYKLKELYLQLIICSNFKSNAGFNVQAYFSNYLKGDLIRESQALQNEQENVLIVMALLKFVFTFKKHLSEEDVVYMVAPVTCFLNHENDVVRYLAAETMSRILPLAIAHKVQLKQTLLQALECLLNRMRTEEQNEFYVRCAMRIFLFLRQDIRESGFMMLDIIVELIKAASDNPVNPVYNHYLFECLSVILRIHLGAGSTEAVSRIEDTLIPTIAIIIQQEMHPFVPYSLQILYVLLRATQRPSDTYVQLFTHLASLESWRASTANAQGSAKLLICYFERYAMFEKEVNSNVENILSIFHYCLTHRKLYVVALDLLNGIVRYLPVNAYCKFLSSIVTVLLTFIHNMKIKDAVPKVITSMALLAASLHMQNYSMGFVEIMESIQAGISQNFIQVVYVPNARKVLSLEPKRVLVLGTAIMMNSPIVRASRETFEMLADFLGDLIQGQSLRIAPSSVDNDDLEQLMQDMDYDVSYVKLRSVEGTDGRSGAKLLDPNLNVEQAVRATLQPIAGVLSQLPAGGSAQFLLKLLN